MTFQPLASETLRRFLRGTKIQHRQDFLDAYKRVGSDRCFVAGAVIDLISDEEMQSLRRFRDQKLMTHRGGRWVVRAYYAVGPHLATVVIRLPNGSREQVARVIRTISKKIA